MSCDAPSPPPRAQIRAGRAGRPASQSAARGWGAAPHQRSRIRVLADVALGPLRRALAPFRGDPSRRSAALSGDLAGCDRAVGTGGAWGASHAAALSGRRRAAAGAGLAGGLELLATGKERSRRRRWAREVSGCRRSEEACSAASDWPAQTALSVERSGQGKLGEGGERRGAEHGAWRLE
jgi:hypothetical protein